MSISGILSSSSNQYQLSAASNPFQQLSKDLQSGNLSASQSDFATLQAAFSQPATSTVAASTAYPPKSTTDPVAQAFNQLATDLKSGNLSAAQKDYSTLQQDLQSPSGSPTHLHNHHRISTGGLFGGTSSTGSGDSSTQNSLLQDLNQIGQSLTSSNLAGAQQAYATLQQQLEQFALGGGSLSSSQSSTLLAQPPVSLEA
jgi:hypothetical protein